MVASLEVAEYVWLGAGEALPAMREPSRAWGASAEEIQMECERWVGALVAVHPCGRQVQSHAETLLRRKNTDRPKYKLSRADRQTDRRKSATMPPSHKLGVVTSLLNVKVRPRLNKGLNRCQINAPLPLCGAYPIAGTVVHS